MYRASMNVVFWLSHRHSRVDLQDFFTVVRDLYVIGLIVFITLDGIHSALKIKQYFMIFC